jgi:hypothetical protein
LILNGECAAFSNASPAVFEYAYNEVLALNSRGIYMHSPTQGNLLLSLDKWQTIGKRSWADRNSLSAEFARPVVHACESNSSKYVFNQ